MPRLPRVVPLWESHVLMQRDNGAKSLKQTLLLASSFSPYIDTDGVKMNRVVKRTKNIYASKLRSNHSIRLEC